MNLIAPAKINLSLAVLGKRKDGFHDIETLMAPISLADKIELNITGAHGIQFTCDAPGLPVDSHNLAVRAANLFCERTGKPPALLLHLRKSVPHGAGLGGGSSDAAAVLLGLDELFQTGLSRQELAVLAAEIGSDVAFFVYQSSALCRGRGEIVEPRPVAEKLRLLLLKPPFGVPTPWAYGRWLNSKEIPGVPYSAQIVGSLTFFNDLERPVYEKYPYLAVLKCWLIQQTEVAAALLSGSGSTMFAVIRPAANCEDLAARAAEEFGPSLWTHACETT